LQQVVSALLKLLSLRGVCLLADNIGISLRFLRGTPCAIR